MMRVVRSGVTAFLFLIVTAAGCSTGTRDPGATGTSASASTAVSAPGVGAGAGTSSGLGSASTLHFEDFESPTFGNSWPTYWGSPPGPTTVSSPTGYVYAGSRSLVCQGRAGEHYSDGPGEYVAYPGPNDGVDEASMSLKLRLEDGFDMGTCNQLKLFGIKGGVDIADSYGGAGQRPTGTDKVTARLAFDRNYRLHFYVYHMDQPGRYGDHVNCDIGGQVFILPGRWYGLEIRVRLNTPGAANGEVTCLVDGVVRGRMQNLRFRTIDAVKLRKWNISIYFGGAGASNTSPKDQRVFVDDVVISSP